MSTKLNEYSEQGICRICQDETDCVRIDDDLFCKYCLPELYRVAIEGAKENAQEISILRGNLAKAKREAVEIIEPFRHYSEHNKANDEYIFKIRCGVARRLAALWDRWRTK